MGEDQGVTLPQVAVWNVVFTDRPARSWWNWICKPGFRHVCAFGFDPGSERWIVIDPGLRYMAVYSLSDVELAHWRIAQKDRETDVLQWAVRDDGAVRMRLGYWCTTAVKCLLGIDSGAFRPQALHRDLLANGARRSFENAEPASPAGGS